MKKVQNSAFPFFNSFTVQFVNSTQNSRLGSLSVPEPRDLSFICIKFNKNVRISIKIGDSYFNIIIIFVNKIGFRAASIN